MLTNYLSMYVLRSSNLPVGAIKPARYTNTSGLSTIRLALLLQYSSVHLDIGVFEIISDFPAFSRVFRIVKQKTNRLFLCGHNVDTHPLASLES